MGAYKEMNEYENVAAVEDHEGDMSDMSEEDNKKGGGACMEVKKEEAAGQEEGGWVEVCVQRSLSCMAWSEKPAWLYYVTLTMLLVRVLLVLLLPPVAEPSVRVTGSLPVAN